MEETTEAFVIDTREKADWLLRKLANLEADEARVKAQSAVMLQQIESDRNSLMGRYQSQLENFTRAELEASKGKRKSITLFNGTVGFRTIPARLMIESEPDAITTARAVAPQTITTETVERFDKKKFMEYATERFEQEGELIPGVGRTEERESFSVKFPSSKTAESE